TEYNRMYKETKNLNRLLAIGHGRVVKALIEKTGEGNDVMSIDGVVSDQFGQKALLEEEIANKYGLKLVQRHSGESNIGVAAASIIARDHFEKRVRSLSEMLAMPLPLGAGNEVRSAAAKIFEKFGRSRLCGTAKMHFKIFKELCYGIQ
ncbi:MAG: ribonuclease HIII, partial [Chitinivibrionales bacterium]